MPLYFAYGSNLDCGQMRERCPSARFVCVAKLKDYGLAFTRKSTKRGCGVADAVSKTGCDVWGVVYEIDDQDLAQLDRCEGYHPGKPEKEDSYNRRERVVLDGGDEHKPLTVMTYFAVGECNPPPPNKQYMGQIIEGAKFWRLPAEYIKELERVEVA